MKKKITKGEKTFYIIGGFFVFIGLVLAVFGIIGGHLEVQSSANWIKAAEDAIIAWSKINWDFRIWGTIFLNVGVLLGVIGLLKYAKKEDYENEKATRRAQRLGQ